MRELVQLKFQPVTWDAPPQASKQPHTFSRARIEHDPLRVGVPYVLQIQPSGQAVTGVPVATQCFHLVYWPYRRYLPVAALTRL